MGDKNVVLDISVSSLSWTRGIVMIYRKVARMAVAVVSEPTILKPRDVR